MSIPENDSTRPKKSSKEIIFTVLRQISYTKLFKKYTSGNFSFSKISINHLIFSATCQIVARFKDFLIYDDNTEFIHRFYPREDANPRLKKIFLFYETYSKIFPNYLVLKENKYLYRNIRKKQKMINAINAIRKEEKENKKKLGVLDSEKNIENNKNQLFTRKIKDEIKIFQKNLSGKLYKNSLDSDNNKEDDTLVINPNSISISILNWKEFEKNNFNNLNGKEINNMDINSFIINNTNDESITKMIGILNDNKIYIKDLPNIFLENKNSIAIRPNIKKQNVKITNKKDNKTGNNIQYNKNQLQKYLKTSSNATTNSSLLSKKNKKKSATLSSNKIKKEIQNTNENNIIKENIKDKETSKKIVLYKKGNENININNKIYNLISPKNQILKYKKKFSTTNSKINIQKTPLYKCKLRKVIKKAIIGNNSEKKDKNICSNHFIHTKTIYNKNKQDLNQKVETKDCDFISSNNNITKKLLTEKNPNLITGDLVNKEQNTDGNIVHVNLRDIIKNEQNIRKKKIFSTAKKPQKSGGLLLKFIKNKPESNIIGKNIKFNENKSEQNLNQLVNLNCNKLKFNTYRPRNDNLISKQKTEENYKIKYKNLLKSKENKSKINTIFKNVQNKLYKNQEENSNTKVNNLKKNVKINKRRNIYYINILINNSNDEMNKICNSKIVKFHTYGNSKIINEKQLTPFKKQKLDKNSKNISSKNNKKNNDIKILKTISNDEIPKKYKRFLNYKTLSKSNNNSKKNDIFLNRIKSTKNNKRENSLNDKKKHLVKTPDVNKTKSELFKKNKTITNRKFINLKNMKERHLPKQNVMSSYTIKVNKAYVNLKKNLVPSNEKFKKSMSNKINSIIKRIVK